MKSRRILRCICLWSLVCLPVLHCTPQDPHSPAAALRSFAVAMLQGVASGRLTPAEAKRIIEARAAQVLAALKAGNMTQLAAFVHPVKGVRFSPYAHVVPGEDLVFQKNQFRGVWWSRERYVWGSFDGSGDAIRLTFRNYHHRFIFRRDFTRAKHVGYNDVFKGTGNTLNNIRAIYPDAIVVEYHIPGVDPKYGGMDWESLWLVFEKEGSTWYLVGVVHDEWTT